MDGIVGVMTPMIDPFAIAVSPPWPTTLPGRQRPVRSALGLSQHRAKIAAMNHDAISAALWALAGFDTALIHFAELREKFGDRDEEDPLRISLDRALSVYVEGQCQELLRGAEITTDEANILVEQRIGDPAEVAMHVLACSSDPLAMELFAYALWLGSITAHGIAPWKRYAWTMADCYYKKHPLAAQ